MDTTNTTTASHPRSALQPRQEPVTNTTGRGRYEQDLVLSPTSPRSPSPSQDIIQFLGTVQLQNTSQSQKPSQPQDLHQPRSQTQSQNPSQPQKPPQYQAQSQSQKPSQLKNLIESLKVTSQLLPITATPCPLEPTEPVFKLPSHLMTQLEKWHQNNPSARPVIVGAPIKYRASKVFDRQGRELLAQAFKITTEGLTYHLQVLCPAEEPEKFVYTGTLNHRYGTWLKAWLGPDKGTEEGFCAIRLFGDTRDDIKFSHQVWDNAPTETPVTNPPAKRGRPRASTKHSPNAPETVSSSGSESESEEIQIMPRRKRNRLQDGPLVLNYRRSSRVPAAPEASVVDPPASASRSPSVATTSSGSTASTDSEGSIDDDRGVVFKFIYPRGVETRVVTVRGTGRGEELFTKGKMFFQLLNPNAKVDCLVCFIPSMNEARHLFDGAWDEVDSLVLEIEALQKKTGKQEVMQVRYARI
ncbi:hypothetical protein PHISCL_07728 [Aspergillus sclerotialis]|uniref:Uncharacterized protein n=1 Tax=Aspergillus sclerotialis TaxID=2070753 RepID=A0A3A2ZPT6_9EURO|nr:hypothetical protein PHISCL_07728 [Aspergillus sclerotialis]